jgi:hypothetical protein
MGCNPSSSLPVWTILNDSGGARNRNTPVRTYPSVFPESPPGPPELFQVAKRPVVGALGLDVKGLHDDPLILLTL